MKLGVKVAIFIACALFVVWTLSQAFSLMSKPSDGGVIGGIAVILIVIIALFTYGERLLNKLRKSNKDQKKEEI